MIRNVAAGYLTSVYGVKGLNGEVLSDDVIKGYSKEERIQLEKNMQSIVGEKMTEKGFMSASVVPWMNIFFARKVQIVIKAPIGSKYYITHNVVESEAVFPLDTELTLESVKYSAKKKKYIIVASVSQNL